MLNAEAGTSAPARPLIGTPALWGLLVGGLQAATPLAFWWLPSATVYALGLAAIASIYIGFTVANAIITAEIVAAVRFHG